jgi:hypothetical protein
MMEEDARSTSDFYFGERSESFHSAGDFSNYRFSVMSDKSEAPVLLSAGGDGPKKSNWVPLPIGSLKWCMDRQGYPNTPVAIHILANMKQKTLIIGMKQWPTLVRVLFPRNPAPLPPGRFSVLPVDSHHFLMADATSHQVLLANHKFHTKRHIAGSGKCGYLDGPLDVCRMDNPAALCLDPITHLIYVADRGNHRIRRVDLSSGLMTTVCGNGTRGHCDSADLLTQSLDSPFEVTFTPPHALLVSCGNNSVRRFDLKTGMLSTIMIGS